MIFTQLEYSLSNDSSWNGGIFTKVIPRTFVVWRIGRWLEDRNSVRFSVAFFFKQVVLKSAPTRMSYADALWITSLLFPSFYLLLSSLFQPRYSASPRRNKSNKSAFIISALVPFPAATPTQMLLLFNVSPSKTWKTQSSSKLTTGMIRQVETIPIQAPIIVPLPPLSLLPFTLKPQFSW